MTVGERIRQKRIELGLSQAELAKRLGYTTRTAISNVETNKEDLTTTRVRKFADALNVTPAYLMGWEDTPSDDLAESASKVQPTVDYMNDNFLLETSNVLGIKRTEYIKALLELMESLDEKSIEDLTRYAKFLYQDSSKKRKDDADD